MADITYRMTADEKQALEACKRVEQAHEKIGSAAERAGTKSKQGSDKSKAGHDSVKQSIDASVSSLASMLSITTAITLGVNEMKTAYKAIEDAVDRLNRKNTTLGKATMGMMGADGRLLITSLREAITAGTASGPVGAEEMSGLIGSLLTSNNELGAGSLKYMETFKKLKGTDVNLQDLAPAIGTIADLMPELLPEDVADVALIAGQNAGGFGKLGEISGVFKELQSKGVSNAQALELAVRAQASDQGSRAVRSVIGAMTPSEQERLAAGANQRPALTGDARLAAIMANPTQYLGAAGSKIQAALNEGLPAGGDIYNQALTKDVVARTAAAAGMDPTLAQGAGIAAQKARQEAAASTVEGAAQVWQQAMEANKSRFAERGYAPDSMGMWAAQTVNRLRLYGILPGGEERLAAASAGRPYEPTTFNPQNPSGITKDEYLMLLKDLNVTMGKLTDLMQGNMILNQQQKKALLTPPQ